ncbi:MAG: hypothetical protein U0168_14140 [Nannocystaceae bacterium]
MMREATGAAAKMWGKAMVGFGEWHYRYPSGREGDFSSWASRRARPR